MDKNIILVGKLNKDFSFFVPAYQRGYRWTSTEVKNLLDDLYEFHSNPKNIENKYCLQPLIVKKRDTNSYEVVDGQQRLTTIYILLKMIIEGSQSSLLDDNTETDLFSLRYETRDDSANFLSAMNAKTNLNTSNIDYFYFTNTAQTFRKWLNNKENQTTALESIRIMLKDKTFFIWYEMPQNTKQKELFELFKKVNIGKIQLTEGELIKALLINKDNFSKDSSKEQEEIALSWDRIEQGLREDSFWYFFNGYENDSNNQLSTRIDILFEVIARKINEELSENDKIKLEEKRFSFLVISKYIERNKEDKEKIIKEIWGKVDFLYAELKFWYNENDLYHIIGYLIASGEKTIFDIRDAIAEKRKSEQFDILLDFVSPSIKIKNNVLELDMYEYGNIARSYIRNLLLLHNIATIVIKEDRELRFPFEILKKRKWDIEHIHALNDSTDEEDNSIVNLALLDEKINREYKDSPFSEKRDTIYKYDKEGRYIPLCTKLVFYKVYITSENQKKSSYDNEIWNDYDKKAYGDNIKSVIEDFFKKDWRINNGK